MKWLLDLWASLTWGDIAIAAAIFVISFAINALIVGIIIVTLPANYFSSHYRQDFLPNSSWMTRWGMTIGKNLVGVLLVIAGVAMLIGPGQGILTILCGLIMIDIPGKRPLEARLIKRPAILAAANALRAKYRREELVVD